MITQMCGARVTPAHSADPTLTHTMKLAKDRKEERASSTEIQEIWIPKTPKPKQQTGKAVKWEQTPDNNQGCY